MKAVRFVTVVERAGRPDVHLMLVDPGKDASFQRALNAHRVMTLHQSGTSDFGVVGFEKGGARQILVFPRSLKAFEGARIVGVKYDLLEDAPAHPKKRNILPKKSKDRPAQKPPASESPPAQKVVAFQRPEPREKDADPDRDPRILDLEAGIHQAMKMLEAGKPVAAFNLLKRLVD